jgi:hypothetical protein
MTTGLKNTIIQHFTTADMLCYFEDNIPRQWYILGSESDINRIPDFVYSDYMGTVPKVGRLKSMALTLTAALVSWIPRHGKFVL